MVDYFHLPISFLDNKKSVEKHVINDLELQKTDTTKSLYEYVFNPDKSPFAPKTIPLWSAYYTSDKHFLKDSQKLIKNKLPTIESDYINVDNIWKEIKAESSFEDRYFYIDWEQLRFLNTNSTFLQCMSVYNMSSPILSLSLPIFFMIFPFILLKLQGIEITMSKYIEIVKIMFQKHQLGQIFMIDSATWEKRVYIMISLGFYIFQMYQNIMSCIRFYKNITKIHDQLFTMRDYIGDTIKRMNDFEESCKTLKTYKPFIERMKEKREILKTMHKDFESVSENKLSFKKMVEIGCIMKYFYQLYKCSDYHNALEYSFGFNGYIHNLNNMKKSVEMGHMSAFKILGKQSGQECKRREDKPQKSQNIQGIKKNKKHKIKFKNAYFPSLIGKCPIKNTYKLKKPMLITGPNAAGKTTMIKTTIFNILCSQQTGFGFYESAAFSPFDYIHSYINIPDTSGRDSLFQSEARRCKDILTIMKEAGDNVSHFCVFDELYSGTNPYEAIASATAFLRYLNTHTNSCYMITTHFLDICNRMEKDKTVLNMHMKIDESPINGDFIYTYKLQKGISNIKGGVKVLRDLGYPQYIIDETKKMIDTIIM
jgi:hypothetical protein